jgi:hypothetical protein
VPEADGQLPDPNALLPTSIEAPPPDELALSEELHLNAPKHLKLIQRQYSAELKRQVACGESRIEKLEIKVDRLQIVEVENAKYKTGDRFLKIVVVICAAAVIVGGLMTASDDLAIKRAGYIVACFALVVQTLVSLINPHL